MRLLVAAALALSAPAAWAESPRTGSFDLRFGTYRPDIDSEFSGTATPYADSFGTSRALMVQAMFSRSLLVNDTVTVDLGFGAGYWEKYGVGVCTDPVCAGQTGDRTSLRIIPLTVAATARLDWLVYKAGVPLAPYFRASLYDYLWWSYGGSGSVAVGPGGQRGNGQTMGWGLTLGLGLVLDFFDAQLAREMDFDTGINHTILFADVTKAWIDDFGSKSSWNLSPDALQWNLGLLFVF